ncbi:hypothetical protein ACTAQI_17365 [Pseudarthrobacter sp. alpha12b]
MKSELGAWAFLRPLLLAVAVAASWIALSAGAASADSSTSSDPLLYAAPSTLGSVTATVAHQAKDVLAPVETGPVDGVAAPASTIPARVAMPTLRPVVEDVTALADDVARAVPVVNTVVPAGTVTAAVDPAVGSVDGVIGGAVGTMVPVAGAVLEPLDPVLEPVIDAVPLPAPLPVAPGPSTGAPAIPAVADVPQAGDGAPPRAAEPEAETASAAPASARALHATSHGNGLACDPRMGPAVGTPLPPGAGPQDAPLRGPSNAITGMPGVATGGSSPSGGNGSTMPAWLDAHNFHVPAAGTVSVEGGRPTAPAPVSFGPGSSPD